MIMRGLRYFVVVVVMILEGMVKLMMQNVR